MERTRNKIICAREEVFEVESELENIENYSYIDCFDKEVILCSQNNIAVLNAKLEVDCYENDDKNTGFHRPKFAIKTDSNTIFVFDNLRRIQKYNSNFQFQSTYQIVEGDDLYNLGNIADVSKDYFGNLFFVDYENGKILTIQKNDEDILELDFNFDFEFDEHSKIAVSPNGDIMAVFSNNNVIVFSLKTSTVKKQISKTSVKHIKFDYLNNLFLVFENSIEKYEFENFEFSQSKNFEFSIKSTSLNIENGEFLILSDKIYKFCPENFFANASKDTPPVDIMAESLSEEICEFARVTSQTKLFATSVSFSSSDDIDKDTIIVCLKKDIDENSQMFYCLATVNDEQKLGYVSKLDVEFFTFENTPSIFQTVCKNVNIYSFPTKNSGVYRAIKNDDSIITVLSDLDGYVDENNNTFFAVLTENGVGYVEQKYLAKTGNFESVKIETENHNTYQREFASYIIIVVCLILMTIATCVFVAKKRK